MSFLDRAKQAAAQAAEGAKQAASQAAEGAKSAAESARHTVTEGAEKASAVMNDPATADRARQALARAKRGVATAIDRIDPGVLADVIIKSTALQERANLALKAKGSPYRISEVSIGAAIPPSITFAIARTDDPAGDVIPDGAIASTALLAEVHADGGGAIRALDGSAIDEASTTGDHEA